MNPLAGSGLGLGLAALLSLGCGKKQPNDLVTVPSALLDTLGVTCRSLHLTRAEAKRIACVRVTYDWEGAPKGGAWTQIAIAPEAQTVFVFIQRQEGSHRLQGGVEAKVDGTPGWTGASGTVDTPFNLSEMATFRPGGPLVLGPGQPQTLMTAGRTTANGCLEDPTNLVKVSVVAIPGVPR